MSVHNKTVVCAFHAIDTFPNTFDQKQTKAHGYTHPSPKLGGFLKKSFAVFAPFAKYVVCILQDRLWKSSFFSVLEQT